MFREVQTRRGGAAHEGEESDTHLNMMAAACAKMQLDFQKKFEEQEHRSEEQGRKLDEQEQKLEELENF